jgi:hypothetical protein
VFGEDVADLVQRGRQAGLADDVRGTAWPLVVQELCGGQGRGPDRRLRYVEAQPPKPCLQVTCRIDGVVRQYQKRLAGLAQPGDELGCARHRLSLVYEDAVHVGEPGLDGLAFSHRDIVA